MNISKLQSLDFLLKRITADSSFSLFERDLKLIVKIDDGYWIGDFIESYDFGSVNDVYLNIFGQKEIEYYHLQDKEEAIAGISQIYELFLADKNENLRTYLAEDDVDLTLLFKEMLSLLSNVEEQNYLPNYLYHPKKLFSHDRATLPFIYLHDMPEIKLISLVDNTK